MARYQLLVDHFVGQALLPAGTEIDTNDPAYADFKPSMHTAGLDPAGKHTVEQMAKRHRTDPVHALPTGFNMNGTIPPEDARVSQPEMSYSVSTPGQSAIPPGASGVVPRVGEIEQASEDARRAPPEPPNTVKAQPAKK